MLEYIPIPGHGVYLKTSEIERMTVAGLNIEFEMQGDIINHTFEVATLDEAAAFLELEKEWDKEHPDLS